MSYDLIFLPRQPGQSWEEALDQAELSDDAADVDPAVWQKIVEGVRRIQPAVAEHGHELTDKETSIQIQCWADEASISVPYWHTGEAARLVMERMFAYAQVISECTGLEGYDQQLGMSVTEAMDHLDEGAGLIDSTAAMLDRSSNPDER